MALLKEVADRGSFSAAARSLGLPVPTLSRRISDLEAALGAQLLVRTTRSLTLTEAGLDYLAAARRILDLVAEAERAAAGEASLPKGELVVTAPRFFGRLHVLPVIAGFLQRFPDIDVRLTLADRNLHLVDDNVDVAVRIGALRSSTMVATRVGAMRSVVCASPDLLQRYGVPDAPRDLAALPTVGLDTLAAQASWQFRGGAEAIDVAVTPRLSVNSAEAALRAAVLGIGIARLFHYQVAEAVAAGHLRIVLADAEPAPAPVHLVHAARGHLPSKMRHFLDYAVPLLREDLRTLG